MNANNNISEQLLKLNGLEPGKLPENDEKKLQQMVNRENLKIKLYSWLLVSGLGLMYASIVLLLFFSQKMDFSSTELMWLWGTILVIFGALLLLGGKRLVSEKKIFKQIRDLLVQIEKKHIDKA
jgi:hypothetical protein